MSARLLLEVALRILGIWLLFGALTKVTQAVAYYNSIALNSEPNIGNYFFAVAWVGIVELGLGLVLIFFAPRVAARFYPRDGEESMLHFRVGPGDIYHTACFVLGVCLLVAGIRAAGQLAVQAMSLGWPAIRLEGNMVTAIVYTTSGVLIQTRKPPALLVSTQ